MSSHYNKVMYGIMTEEHIIHEIRINEAAFQGDLDSGMTHSIYSIRDIKSVLHYTISMHNTKCPILRSIALNQLVIRENE